MYVFTQPLHHKQNATNSQFLSGLNSELSFPRLVAQPKLKNPAWTNIYSIDERRTAGFMLYPIQCFPRPVAIPRLKSPV